MHSLSDRAAYGDSLVKENVLQHLQAAGKQPIQDIVEQGIASGDLRTDLDPDLATFMILTAGDNLRYFIPEKQEIDTANPHAGDGHLSCEVDKLSNGKVLVLNLPILYGSALDSKQLLVPEK